MPCQVENENGTFVMTPSTGKWHIGRDLTVSGAQEAIPIKLPAEPTHIRDSDLFFLVGEILDAESKTVTCFVAPGGATTLPVNLVFCARRIAE